MKSYNDGRQKLYRNLCEYKGAISFQEEYNKIIKELNDLYICITGVNLSGYDGTLQCYNENIVISNGRIVSCFPEIKPDEIWYGMLKVSDKLTSDEKKEK